MGYSDTEISNQDGKPVFLYEFRYDTSYFRYTNADQDLTFFESEPEEVTYEAVAISDAGFTQGGSDQNDFTVTLPSNNAVAVMFKNTKPSGKVWLTVRAWHFGDDDADQQIQWLGTVTNSILADRATATLACRSIGGTYDRNGLRLVWQRQCPHFLYGSGCFVPKADHAYPRTIDTLTGTNFTCTAHAEPDEGSFSGGLVEWLDDNGNTQRRAISLQDGNDFRVLGTTLGLTVGLEVTVYPGCARDTVTCKKFGPAPRGNLDNYGGIPHLTGTSPFDGTPIF